MRRFFTLLASAILSLQPALAQPVRVVTWELDEVSMPSGDPANAEADEAQLKQIATALKPAKADVIILYGLGDRQLVKKFAGFLKQPHHHYTGPSTFRRNGGNTPHIGRPLAIFSRTQPVVTRSLEWRTSGQIDLPGGFHFSTYRFGSNALSIYSVHWPENDPSGATNLAPAKFAGKRELAAQYLLHHAKWIASTLSNQPLALYLTGDVSGDAGPAGRGVVEQALGKAGFQTAVAEGAKDRLLATFSNTPAMLNPVFIDGLNFVASPELVAMKGFLDPVLVCDIAFPNLEAAARAPLPTLPGINGSPSKRLTADRRALWWGVGGMAALLLAVMLLRTWRAQIRGTPLAVSRRANDSLVVELSHTPPAAAEAALAEAEASSFGSSVTETSTGHNPVWQSHPSRAEVRPASEGSGDRARLMPHLSRLMREKLFVWLSAQRSQLIDSHESGTQQVLSLEERLERIQGQFQQKLIAQESRIAELQKHLQAKEQIIRSLHQQQADVDETGNV